MAATYTRQNVYSLGNDWADPILWYARGVKAMNARALNDPLGWRFFAGIHGLDQTLWTQLGYLSSSDQMPSSADFKLYWEQCQHGTWYFLPWHRGYLLALEATIRANVVSLGGPSTWALPYWNYFGPGNENQLPPAFASADWPDGQGDNPLYVPQRYGPNNDQDVFVPLDQVNLDAMGKPDFTGPGNGGDPGFGGVDTGFAHGGGTHGDLETQPHDWVHGLVGGQDPNSGLPGLMSDPDTAGLDPIFYLHHANIDRLWAVWVQSPISLGNPTDQNWVNGPASVGDRGFAMPMPPNGTAWSYTPGDMANLANQNYTYDDLASPVTTAPAVSRLQMLGIAPAIAASQGGAAMAPTKVNVELVGANQQPLAITGSAPIRTSVQLDQEVHQKVRDSIQAATAGFAAAAEATPDRVFLNLENVRGFNDATAFRVYVNDILAGSIALFGVRKATVADGEHGGEGLTFVLEITKIIDQLHLQNALDVSKLDVRVEPIKHVPEEAKISIGRVSIFRQGV